jgi:2-dehydro-3-deoxyphosphogluconate aldolase / (4S)-4-hydroxy-2-oxoglutarate aldolase
MSDAMQARQDQALALMRAARILPILTVESVEQALAVVAALRDGGLTAIELTLRTPAALPALAALKQALPTVSIGAGTVLDAHQLAQSEVAGADFIVTPGTTPALREALAASALPVIAGVATPSEALALREHGFRVAKLFPAAAVGGITMLQALRGPLPDLMFCPTGGIGEADAADYLAQPNVACIGGSWMVPKAWLQAGDWTRVRESAARARAIIDRVDARAG